MNINRLSALVCACTLSLSLLTGCGTQPADTAAGDGRLRVLTSFYPMYDFACKIGGDCIDVTNMVPSGTEPHDWEPSTNDLKNLEKADVFIYNGADMEPWADDLLVSRSDTLRVVEASENVELRTTDGEHEHAHEHEDADHHHGDFDPHVWLDPENAKIEMEAIRDALCAADPENSTVFQSNYEKYAAELDALDAEFREKLAPLPNRTIVVAHEAFGYLCDAYGLTQVGIEGLSPDSEPDPGRMAEVIDFVREHSISTIFFEELVSPKVAEAIASETGAQAKMLSPLEGLSDEQAAAGADYFSVMHDNLAALMEALN
ncbi:metal ABC transporter substrate-binding protein [Agathobaculum butyriciproducens]|mgnify:FL=1|uniref:Zinc ABC transporter substrate-binding protein n=1 Tax=Agathobaculum hominis TaxID=2763014 RepID=A0ABR7GJX7_9FIRM|nr:metal ABC transporter substrate-binding protein [Agathobaculum hominis]MBC5694578.1 zinc ABC transporter substrate-binding protein [Agathobaculum hominis]MCO7161080.1 metal ABC transporter substrate-binding protein [Agathobaculum butyriciproducens]